MQNNSNENIITPTSPILTLNRVEICNLSYKTSAYFGHFLQAKLPAVLLSDGSVSPNILAKWPLILMTMPGKCIQNFKSLNFITSQCPSRQKSPCKISNNILPLYTNLSKRNFSISFKKKSDGKSGLELKF